MLRAISIILAVSALVLPAAWAWWQMEVAAQAMQSAQGWVCGTPLIGIVLLSVLGAVAMAVAALVAGTVAFRRLPNPRPRARRLELLLLGVPLVCAAAVLVWFP